MFLSVRQNSTMHHVFAMGGRALSQKSCDAGERWMLADVAGAPLRAWDERGHTKRATYDAARRATHAYVQQGTAAEQLVGRTVYGEAHPSAAALNLRGKAFQVYDGAGVVTSGAYDFKGNLLNGSRRLAVEYHSVPEWSALAGLTDVAAIATAAESLLEAEVFSSATAYDALNRPTSLTAPDSSEIRPTYNEAGLLEKVEARVRGASAWTTFVDDIDYDAKGQREQIVYGNGTTTKYTYDPETFRLVRLRTVRDSDGAVLQNLAYEYDPVGNIAEITDSAQRTVFFDNAVVSPSTRYVYDALYRLIEASGREHAGGMADVQRDQNDVPLRNLPHANDAAALRNYVESYVYDGVGNILSMHHDAGAVDWTRRYEIAATSNRLLSTSLPEDEPTATHYSAMYAYDAHGSMTSMPHLPSMGWDHNDQMRQVGLGGGGTAYYTYDAAGQRVRKVWEHSGLVEERIYLGGWEIYRKRDSLGSLLVERETLHGMDGTRRVVLVETKTVDVDAGGAFTVVSRFRFQLGNHLGSASLEVDEAGLVIGYEEYHPYGTTAYASGRGGVEVSGKRYRYTGKERDEETGLYYHGARHLLPWLGRWTSADPAGMVDGINVYGYVRANPIVFNDPTGHLSWNDAKKWANTAVDEVKEQTWKTATSTFEAARGLPEAALENVVDLVALAAVATPGVRDLLPKKLRGKLEDHLAERIDGSAEAAQNAWHSTVDDASKTSKGDPRATVRVGFKVAKVAVAVVVAKKLLKAGAEGDAAAGDGAAAGGPKPVFGQLPKGAKVIKSGADYVVFDVDGVQHIRFKAAQSRQVAPISARPNNSNGTMASVADDGKVYVFEGCHRACAAAKGGVVAPERGGVPGAAGVLEYKYDAEAMAGPEQTKWGAEHGTSSATVKEY